MHKGILVIFGVILIFPLFSTLKDAVNGLMNLLTNE